MDPHRSGGWKKSSAELVNSFAAAIAELPELEPRQMFGYPAAFANGHLVPRMVLHGGRAGGAACEQLAGFHRSGRLRNTGPY